MLKRELQSIMNRLIGSGRAFRLKTRVIKALFVSINTLLAEAIKVIQKTVKQQFPYLMDDAVLRYWEENYNIRVRDYTNIDSRRAMVNARWVNQGNQSAAYLELMFNQAGFDVQVIENLEGDDLTTEWDANIRVANGEVYYYNENNIQLEDRINKPTNESEWRRVFIVQGDLDIENYYAVRDIIVEFKRASSVAIIVDLTPTALDFDANLVVSEIPDYDADANLVDNLNDPTYDIDENLIIFP